MNHPEEVKAIMERKNLKSSEILRKALEMFDNGKKWANQFGGNGNCCSVQAICLAAPSQPFTAQQWLRTAVRMDAITDWNDAQTDFSVIQQGFEKAIALAEAEGD